MAMTAISTFVGRERVRRLVEESNYSSPRCTAETRSLNLKTSSAVMGATPQLEDEYLTKLPRYSSG